jgi:hypothetical protein
MDRRELLGFYRAAFCAGIFDVARVLAGVLGSRNSRVPIVAAAGNALGLYLCLTAGRSRRQRPCRQQRQRHAKCQHNARYPLLHRFLLSPRGRSRRLILGYILSVRLKKRPTLSGSRRLFCGEKSARAVNYPIV